MILTLWSAVTRVTAFQNALIPRKLSGLENLARFEKRRLGSSHSKAMLLGYNTNGLAFHRWQDGLELLAEVGYRAVAITVDHHCLNPFSPNFMDQFHEMQRLLGRCQLRSVIETGARFLLDPHQKHEPTLISPTSEGRSRRVDFLCRCVDIAKELNSDAVSFWAGVCRGDDESLAWQWLLDGCRRVTDYAEQCGVQLAFEPEPGMLVETLEQYGRLAEQIDSPRFGLTIDIGHVQCAEDGSIADHLRRWYSRLCNVHIEDMRRGVHEHLRFGEGEIDFPPVMAALREIGYTGCVNVELSRHSHMAPEVLRESFEFLSKLLIARTKRPFEIFKKCIANDSRLEGVVTLERRSRKQPETASDLRSEADEFVASLGLAPIGTQWRLLDPKSAIDLLAGSLQRSLAYKVEMLPCEEAHWIADEFASFFRGDMSVYLTHGSRITKSTFETAYIVLDSDHIGLFLFEDED